MAENRFNMPFELNVNSIRDYWKNLSRPVQISAVAVVVALIIFIIVMIVYFTRPRMETLFSGMEPQQAREVTEKLEELGVTYSLDEGGTVILVPAGEQDRLRLQLSPDLYSQGMGFSVFEQDGIMVSDHDRKKQWQVVLQDELQRTISSIEAVQSARVHLVLPEEGVFLRDRTEPTASVFLKMRPMATLTEQQVRGVLCMLAGSVENLKPENISIVDSKGKIIYDGFMEMEEELPMVEAAERLHAQRQFERELEEKLKNYLEIVFGPENVVAMVSAELDFDRQEITSITYDQEPVERAIHRIQENEEGTRRPPEEVAEPNIPGYEAPYIYDGDFSRDYLEETINYEISEIQEYVTAAQGGVRRLSATVIINRDSISTFIGEDVTTLVGAAIGYDAERGDAIAVQAIPFDTSVEDREREAAEAAKTRIQTIIGAVALFLMIAIIIALVVLRRRRKEEAMEMLEDAEELEGFDITELLEKEEPAEIEDDIRDKIRKVAESEPENVAYLLRTWLTEE